MLALSLNLWKRRNLIPEMKKDFDDFVMKSGANPSLPSMVLASDVTLSRYSGRLLKKLTISLRSIQGYFKRFVAPYGHYSIILIYLCAQMIVVTYSHLPLLVTDKGTIKRQPNLDAYAEDIRAAYTAFENASRHDVTIPTLWDAHSSTAFARSIVTKVLGKSIGDSEDIFQCGADR